MQLNKLYDYIKRRDFRITDHAFEEMRADDLVFLDIITGVMTGEIIENYPDAYPLPACLINGKTKTGKPIHICISMPPLVKVITVYRPDPAKWTSDFRKKR